MTIAYVQFESIDEVKVVAILPGPQDPDYYPNQGEVQDDDPRYLAFLVSLNPPPDVLALQSAKLQGFIRLSTAQKLALTERISTINDAIEMEMVTPEEEAELVVRTAQLKQWKTYAVLLGRVTAQSGWYATVVWPAQPTGGMDLTVSASAPETI